MIYMIIRALLLPLGDLEILDFAPNVYAEHPEFQGFRDFGGLTTFLEPSLDNQFVC